MSIGRAARLVRREGADHLGLLEIARALLRHGEQREGERVGRSHEARRLVQQLHRLLGPVEQERAPVASPKGGDQSEGGCRERAQGSRSSCGGWGGALRSSWEGARAARRRGGPGGQLSRGAQVGGFDAANRARRTALELSRGAQGGGGR
eukprot:133668-Prymnesium_polylepis.1